MAEPAPHIKIDYQGQAGQCQVVSNAKQCGHMAVEGSDKCALHGGNNKIEAAQAQATRIYNLAMWQQQVGKFADDVNVKSILMEIGVLRMLLERKLVSCRSDNELILRSAGISDLVVKITKAVEACDRMDVRTGQMLHRQQILEMGNALINIISKYITDPEVLKLISNEMITEITTVKYVESKSIPA